LEGGKRREVAGYQLSALNFQTPPLFTDLSSPGYFSIPYSHRDRLLGPLYGVVILSAPAGTPVPPVFLSFGFVVTLLFHHPV